MKRFIKHFRLYFDRSFSRGLLAQILWLLAFVILVYIGLVGLSYFKSVYYPGAEDSMGRWFDIMFLLVDPGTGNGSMSYAFTMLCALFGLVVFGGMLISVISNVLERRMESYRNGETNYRMDHHVVILGYNKSVPSLLRVIHERHKDAFVVLMANGESEEIRSWINSNVPDDIYNKLVVLNGVRNASDDLGRLGLCNQVQEIFVLGEENELDEDGTNMECVAKMAELLSSNDGKDRARIDCHVQFASNTMFSIVKLVDLDDRVKSVFNVIPFDFDEIWAQKALAIVPKDDYYLPLDGQGITKNSPKHVHLVIVGMNEMSEALAVNAAHILHFPNYKEGDFDTCSQITFIDTESGDRGPAFRARYGHLFELARWRQVGAEACNAMESGWHDPIGDADSSSPYKHLGPKNFIDIQWEFVEGDVNDAMVRAYLDKVTAEADAITTLAICMENSNTSIAICLSLPESTLRNAHEILVRQKENAGMLDQLRKNPKYTKARAFGMMTNCYEENLLSDKYGKLINACFNNCSFDGSDEDNDNIDQKWHEISPMEKWSSNYCANMLFVKLRFLGLDTSRPLQDAEIDVAVNSIENRDLIQTTEHNRWITERLLFGVRPLFKEEFDDWRDNWMDKAEEVMNKKKKAYRAEMTHVDICSNAMLREVDPTSIGKDNVVNEKLYLLYRLVLEM